MDGKDYGLLEPFSKGAKSWSCRWGKDREFGIWENRNSIP